MKTNEAPEKIYISNFNIEALPKNEQLSERWYEVSTQDTDIEYTRTDAFIEKACKKLEKCMYDNLMFQERLHRKEVIETFIEDFKNSLKGE